MIEWVQRRHANALDIPLLPWGLRWGLTVAGQMAFLVLGDFGAQEFVGLQFQATAPIDRIALGIVCMRSIPGMAGPMSRRHWQG